MITQTLPYKHVLEVLPITVDYSPILHAGELLVSVGVTIAVVAASGSTDGMLAGEPSISGSMVTQTVAFGTEGATYSLTFSVVTSEARALNLYSTLVVLPDFAWTPASEVIDPPVGPTITGDAPDGVLGTPWPGYAYTITAGSSPVKIIYLVGTLPTPFWLNPFGVIPAATPAGHAGLSSFTINCIDQNGLSFHHPDTIDIACAEDFMNYSGDWMFWAPPVDAYDVGPVGYISGNNLTVNTAGGDYLNHLDAWWWSFFVADIGQVYLTTTFNKTFAQVGSGSRTNNGLTVYPSDNRINPLAFNASNLSVAVGGNFTSLAVYSGNDCIKELRPTEGESQSWYHAPMWNNGYDGGGSAFIHGDNFYLGVRRSGAGSYVWNSIYRWSLTDAPNMYGVSPALSDLPISSVVDNIGPIFRFCVSRQGYVYVLNFQMGTFTRYNSDLGSPVSMPLPTDVVTLLGDGYNTNHIHTVGVDEVFNVMMFSYNNVVDNTTGLLVYRLDGTSYKHFPTSMDVSGTDKHKLFFCDLGMYYQMGSTFYFFDISNATCYLP